MQISVKKSAHEMGKKYIVFVTIRLNNFACDHTVLPKSGKSIRNQLRLNRCCPDWLYIPNDLGIDPIIKEIIFTLSSSAQW